MPDIRKRVSSKGTTYQVRYACKTNKSGYAYQSFDTRKEALAFRENARAHARTHVRKSEIRTVADGVEKWLDVCEKEGRSGRDPVTAYTLKTYRYRADIIEAYAWNKDLQELTAPDVVEFRSWLSKTYSRDQARKVLRTFIPWCLNSSIAGSYLRSVIDRIEVDESEVRIIGRNAVLEGLVMGGGASPAGVPSFIRKWRALRDSNS